ncbi:hypothetical protein J6590_065716 [Homalodisca vitripennis]|nr:hypothetical protein J6590_065716 [Homalodisca vitripennis]
MTTAVRRTAAVDLFCEATSDSPGQYFVTVHNHILAVHRSVPALCSFYIRQPRAELCHSPQPHPCCSLLSTSAVLIVVDIAYCCSQWTCSVKLHPTAPGSTLSLSTTTSLLFTAQYQRCAHCS